MDIGDNGDHSKMIAMAEGDVMCSVDQFAAVR